MTLEQYLKNHLGESIPQIQVLSANKQIKGVVESVNWDFFPVTHSTASGDIDIEKSWVTIKWENGKKDINSVDFMCYVTLCEEA